MQVFKIVDTDEWKAAQKVGVYSGSAVDKADGFIHLSTSAQLAITLTKHFAQADNLTIVSIDSDALGSALKWEMSGSGEIYPHLYGDLEMAVVNWCSPVPKRADGVFELPVQAFVETADASGPAN